MCFNVTSEVRFILKSGVNSELQSGSVNLYCWGRRFFLCNFVKMDNKEEYHDPDYPERPVVVKEEPQEESDVEKIQKIKRIIRREFSNELELRENEVMQIEQR